jgi:DNA-directed RNA polymerase subunit E'/Rpb7
MTEQTSQQTKKTEPTSQKQKLYDVFARGLINDSVILDINNIGENLKETLEIKIKHKLEGKCCKEGYIKENSVKILTYSSGVIKSGCYIEFEIVLEALICLPVEGMLLECTAESITKAGIKAIIKDVDPSPMIVFIARDHFNTSKHFSRVKESDNIIVRVIGQRFELNDTFISIMGELVEPKKKKKIRLVLNEE